MQITILADEHIRLDTDGPDGLVVEGEPFAALQMLAASLALCTVSVAFSYGETAGLDLQGFAVEVRWHYVDDPYRVGSYEMTLHIPATVPEARHRAIVRAADTCTVHNTLLHPTPVETTVQIFDPSQPSPHHHHHHHHHHAPES